MNRRVLGWFLGAVAGAAVTAIVTSAVRGEPLMPQRGRMFRVIDDGAKLTRVYVDQPALDALRRQFRAGSPAPPTGVALETGTVGPVVVTTWTAKRVLPGQSGPLYLVSPATNTQGNSQTLVGLFVDLVSSGLLADGGNFPGWP